MPEPDVQFTPFPRSIAASTLEKKARFQAASKGQENERRQLAGDQIRKRVLDPAVYWSNLVAQVEASQERFTDADWPAIYHAKEKVNRLFHLALPRPDRVMQDGTVSWTKKDTTAALEALEPATLDLKSLVKLVSLSRRARPTRSAGLTFRHRTFKSLVSLQNRTVIKL